MCNIYPFCKPTGQKSPDLALEVGELSVAPRPKASPASAESGANLSVAKTAQDSEQTAPLGINTKYSAAQSPRGFQGIRKKYKAGTSARAILTKRAKQLYPKKYPNEVYRTAGCMHVMISDFVGINRNEQYDSVFYTGLQVCGSVWACPICAAKIQERRRSEIEKAIEWANINGYYVSMVTLTFPHYVWQKLETLLTQQAKAFKYLRSCRAWSDMRKRVGMDGFIRSLECVYGQNGWHPHTHELWITKEPIGNHWILEQWEKACIRAGLLDPENPAQYAAFRQYSVDVRQDVDSGDYLAKQDDSRAWGLSDELAKATTKVGRSKGIHPHGLLLRGLEGDSERYIEYVESMKGRRQLLWSKGLKTLVGVDEVDDETLADEGREVSELLVLLTADHWRVIAGSDARAEFLEAAYTGGLDSVRELFALLGGPPI